MIDPVSAIGIAAGTVQFVDVSISTVIHIIKLLESLKNTPSRISKLLEDLDKSTMRLHAIQNVMQQPDSPFLKAPRTQYERLLAALNSACEAILDLQRLLDPLFGAISNTAHNCAKKTWRSVVSVVIETKIAAKVERLGRLNEEIIGEMLLAGTEMQGRLDTSMLQTQQSLATVRNDLISQRDLLQLSHNAIPEIKLQFESQLSNIQTQIASSTDTIQSGLILDSTRTIRQMHQMQNSLEASIQTTMKRENLETKAEIASFRQTLLKLLSGDRGPSINNVLDSSRPGLLEDAKATNELGRQLATSPDRLREVCNRFAVPEGPGQKEVCRDHPLGAKIGRGMNLQQGSIRRLGQLGIVVFSSANTYQARARQKRLKHRSWRGSIFLQLLPVLQTTVEVTFAANFGAGGNSIAVSLRYYGTVRRSGSPMFQLIDTFTRRCARKVYAKEEKKSFDAILITRSQHVLRDNINFDRFVLDWDLGLLDTEVPKLCQELSENFIADYCAASYSDENGNTLLHALVVLIGLLGVYVENFSLQFEALAHRLITAGVSVNAMCHRVSSEFGSVFDESKCILPSSSRRYEDAMTDQIDNDILGKASTAIGLAMRVTLSFAGPCVRLPLQYTVLSALEEEDPIEIPNIRAHHSAPDVTMHVKSACMKFLRNYPQLLTYFGYGLFEKAILNRWTSQVESLLEDEFTKSQILETDYSDRVSPADMAVGWPTGIGILRDCGFTLDSALQLAISVKDLETTKMILASDSFPREEETWREVLGLLSWSSWDIQSVVLCDLARRRIGLANLAMDHLSTEQALKLGLSTGQALDNAAFEVLQELQTKTVRVHPTLFPASKFVRNDSNIPIDHVSVYIALFSESYPDKGLLQLAYDNGFMSIDSCEKYNRTPLFLACEFHKFWFQIPVQIIHWLLDKGADTNFRHQNDIPNIIFPLASLYGKLIRENILPQCSDIRSIIDHALSRPECQSLSTDGCRCYCSHKGCLPLYRFWTCHKIAHNMDHELCSSVSIPHLVRAMEQWISICALDSDQALQCYKQAMKLEVFERLGMMHTCCQNPYRTNLRIWTLDMEERARLFEDYETSEHPKIREDSKVLKEQLDLIILGYSERFKSHTGTLGSFWETAMLDLSRILPESSPEERCRGRCLSTEELWDSQDTLEFAKKKEERHNSTLDAQAALLKQNGYKGWDFMDVIRHHFRDCLGNRAVSEVDPSDPH